MRGRTSKKAVTRLGSNFFPDIFRISSKTFSSSHAGLYTRGEVRASYTSVKATIRAPIGISFSFKPAFFPVWASGFFLKV